MNWSIIILCFEALLFYPFRKLDTPLIRRTREEIADPAYDGTEQKRQTQYPSHQLHYIGVDESILLLFVWSVQSANHCILCRHEAKVPDHAEQCVVHEV